MTYSSSQQRGIAPAVVVIIVAVALIGVGAVYYFSSRTTSQEVQRMEEKKMMEKDKKDAMVQYSGAVLAGTSAPLLDFTKADFDAAVKSDKLVVLYFYANWCPICREEFPKAEVAFNELTTDQVIGFRVNFNDNQTDSDEQALARQHGVAYQHTKVFIKNSQQVLKSPESWEQSRYVTEITNALAK